MYIGGRHTMNPRTTNRVTSQGLGFALAVIIVYVLKESLAIDPPDEVVLAIGTVVTFTTQILFSKFGFVQSSTDGD